MFVHVRHLALVALLTACSSEDKSSGRRDDDADEASDEGAAERVDARAPAGKDAAVRRDAGDAARPAPRPTDPGDDSCAAVDERAEARLQPVDIIWAIDTSGSMTASFPAIQQALTSFSSKVSQAGIDAHIVLLAGAGLCVPAPVGSGSCGVGIGGGLGAGGLIPALPAPDTKAPNFLHLDVPFGANQGMPVILNSYPQYSQMLRRDAHTHLVLTEDGAPPQSADEVVAQLEGASWGLAPGSWTFHGVVCKDGLGGGACLLAFQPPTTTLALVERSGGIAADLSQAGGAMDPFAALLDELATRVIVGAELSCEYDIPPVPQGQTFDRELVNVRVRSGAGEQQLPQAKGVACDDYQAWTYDDEQQPTKIILCPAACAAVRAEPETELEVQFGCEAITVI